MAFLLSIFIMEENQKKAFDFASDVTKQLITLSTAIIVITITFSKDFMSTRNQDSLWYIFIAWALFILSICFGILTLMALTGTLQPLSKKNGNNDLDKISINSSNIRFPSKIQIITFILGVIFTVIFGYRSFTHSYSKDKKHSDIEGINLIIKSKIVMEMKDLR